MIVPPRACPNGHTVLSVTVHGSGREFCPDCGELLLGVEARAAGSTSPPSDEVVRNRQPAPEPLMIGDAV